MLHKLLKLRTTTTGLTVLETLQIVRGTLTDPDKPYQWSEWETCTCGHIYSAAIGAPRPRSLYAAVVATIRAAWPEYAERYAHDSVSAENANATEVDDLFVSYLTLRLGLGYGEQDGARKAAIKIIDRAIEYERGRHEQARLTVLAGLGEMDAGEPASSELVAQ